MPGRCGLHKEYEGPDRQWHGYGPIPTRTSCDSLPCHPRRPEGIDLVRRRPLEDRPPARWGAGACPGRPKGAKYSLVTGGKSSIQTDFGRNGTFQPSGEALACPVDLPPLPPRNHRRPHGAGPDLHAALDRAEAEGMAHLISDGRIVDTDRLYLKTRSKKGKEIDRWYSGKPHDFATICKPSGPREGGPSGSATSARQCS